jgi:probable phosphoglycerate mutase
MRPPLWVVRHGETEWNRERRLQGRFDSPLTELGRSQARGAAAILLRLLGPEPDVDLIVSPRGRAVATATFIADALRLLPRIDERLVEATMGAWDGLTRAEIAARHPALDLDTVDLRLQAPGAETLAALRARVDAFLADLDRPTIAVTHGLCGQMLRGVYLGLDDAAARRLPDRQDVIFALQDGRERVLDH